MKPEVVISMLTMQQKRSESSLHIYSLMKAKSFSA